MNYDPEFYLSLTLFAFLGMIMAVITWNCFLRPMLVLLKNKSKECWDRIVHQSRNITMEDMQALTALAENQLDNYLQSVEEKEFFKMIEDAQAGKYEGATPLPQTKLLPVLVPCVYHDCSMHTTRADCCHSEIEVNGQTFCTALIDIDTMQEAGVRNSECVKVPEILTDEEVKEFQKAYIQFIKVLESKGLYKDTVK